MNLPFRLKMAKQKAEAFLREKGIAALPVDPFAIAASCDIEVSPKPDCEGGVSGMLLRHGNNFAILYATHIKSEGFQRFSISHELGHYFLEGHIDHVLGSEGIHVSHGGFVSADPFEQEADCFAAGLLMPEMLFKQALRERDPGLAAVESMAGLCKVSLPAAGIRCAEITDHAIAVIVSTGPVIDYCILSNAMKSLPDLTWLRRGSPLPQRTATANLNANADAVRNCERVVGEVDALDWLGGKRSVILCEEVSGLGSYGKTLTVLSSDSLALDAESDDFENEEDLTERWTPRFRR